MRDDTEKQAAFEERASQLIGKCVTAVRYFGLSTADPWQSYAGDRFDSMEFGLDLELDADQTVGIIWDWEFAQYGLSLKDHSLADELHGSELLHVWEVTSEVQWAALIDMPITSVQVHWDSAISEGSTPAPVCLAISFAVAPAGRNHTIYLCAGQYFPESDTLALGGDEVAVIFRDEMVQHYSPTLLRTSA